MEPESDVTIAVPTYNNEETLPRTLWSIEHLDPSPRTVLCVDDGSHDASADIADNHDGIEVIRHDTNRGLAAALNTALGRTTTPWLAKVDADIVLEPDWLGTLSASADEHDVVRVAGRATERVGVIGDRWRASHNTIDYFGDEPLPNHPRTNGSNTLNRVSALQDVGGWSEQSGVSYSDTGMNERLLRAGYDIYYEPTARAEHVRSDTWLDALRTSWRYTNTPDQPAPTDFSEMIGRLPGHASEAVYDFAMDVYKGNFELTWISLLGFAFDVWWDLEHVMKATDRGVPDEDVAADRRAVHASIGERR